jgi:DNA-binding IscR family transcriptional regulator
MRRRATSDRISAAKARAALSAMLLMSTAPERLNVSSLARSYRVPPTEIERMLQDELQRRARR